MLADELLAGPVTEWIGREASAKLAHDMRGATRFVLDDAFAAAADELAMSRPSMFEKVISFCRPPSDLTWIEVNQSARTRFSIPPQKNEIAVKKVGILIQSRAADHSRWVATIAYRDANDNIVMSPFSIAFDPSWPTIGLGQQDQALLKSVRESHRSSTSFKTAWKVTETEVFAQARTSKRFSLTDTLYTHEANARLRAQVGDDRADDYLRRQAEDNNSEFLFWLGVLVMINSRNVGTTVPGEDLTKINRVRQKTKKVPLMPYRVCKLSGRLAETLRRRHQTSDLAAARAHFVRGHFKARASGVYWWSPFIRGDTQLGFVNKHYEVA